MVCYTADTATMVMCLMTNRRGLCVQLIMLDTFSVVKKFTMMYCGYRYAGVTSIRMLPEKYCAFVNLKSKEDAGRAMKHLQVRIVVFSCWGIFLKAARKQSISL